MRWRQLPLDSTSLNLWNEDVDEEGLEHLVSFLPQCLQVKVLYLDDEHFKHLAPVLPQCLQLQEFHLWSIIGDEVVKQLASVLPQCLQLQYLDLWGNLDDEGLKRLAPILPQCLKLQKLDLGNDTIGDEGMRHIAQVLPLCRQLQKLTLWGNVREGIREKVDALLRRLCAARPMLALLGVELSGETPLSRFTRRDGDRAVICRVIGFLI